MEIEANLSMNKVDTSSGFREFNYMDQSQNNNSNSNRNQSKNNKYCSYHKVNSHDTKECRSFNPNNTSNNNTISKPSMNNNSNFCSKNHSTQNKLSNFFVKIVFNSYVYLF